MGLFDFDSFNFYSFYSLIFETKKAAYWNCDANQIKNTRDISDNSVHNYSLFLIAVHYSWKICFQFSITVPNLIS